LISRILEPSEARKAAAAAGSSGAVANPMPLFPPVINAIFELNFDMLRLSFSIPAPSVERVARSAVLSSHRSRVPQASPRHAEFR
jgi:hypothetical protein